LSRKTRKIQTKITDNGSVFGENVKFLKILLNTGQTVKYRL
jgi:hypothetical protein